MLFNYVSPNMSMKLFINAFSNQNRGGSIVRGGLTPPFRQIIIRKCPNLSNMVQNVTKTPNLVQIITMQY